MVPDNNSRLTVRENNNSRLTVRENNSSMLTAQEKTGRLGVQVQIQTRSRGHRTIPLAS
jgi:hypothetical protein